MTYQPDSASSKPSYYSERTEIHEPASLNRSTAYANNFPYSATMGSTRVRDGDGEAPVRERVNYINSGPAMEAPPPLGVYLRGLGSVLWHALTAYTDLLLDIGQSLLLLFLQHPTIGIFFTVLALFVLTPLLVFLGFSAVSFVSVLVGAFILEGLLMGGGVLVLFFALPTGFVVGLGAAAAAAAVWLALDTLVKAWRGRGIVEELLPARYRALYTVYTAGGTRRKEHIIVDDAK